MKGISGHNEDLAPELSLRYSSLLSTKRFCLERVKDHPFAWDQPEEILNMQSGFKDIPAILVCSRLRTFCLTCGVQVGNETNRMTS